MDKSEINDKRDLKEFSKITFSKYSKIEARKELIECLIACKIEPACYWCAEFVCAGHFADIWEIIIQFMSTNIHLGSPKLPIYIEMRFQDFKQILESGYIKQEIRLRNNKKIRRLFAEVISILCLSRKNHAFTPVKIKKEEFHISNLTIHLKAKSVKYGQVIFRRGDPKELFIPINELSYHLSRDSHNSRKACYWVEWIIDFSNLCVKEKKECRCERREDMPVVNKFQFDPIWLIWELLLYYSKSKNTICTKIILALLKLFCIRYSSGMKKRRRFFIYFAISLINESVNYNIKILERARTNSNIIENISKKIDMIYTQIKKNEIAPNTNYLFNNSLSAPKNNNLENTIKKLDTLNALTNIMPRK